MHFYYILFVTYDLNNLTR